MSISNLSSAVSRSARQTVRSEAASTWYASSWARDGRRRTLPFSCASTLPARASMRSLTSTTSHMHLPGDGAGTGDLLLQLHDPVDQHLRRRRAAGDVDIDR